MREKTPFLVIQIEFKLLIDVDIQTVDHRVYTEHQ